MLEITGEWKYDELKQPELPVMKNQDQRKAFIEGYKDWPIWINNEATGEKYYRYDFPNGVSFVIKVYYHKCFDMMLTGFKWEERYRPGWGGEEYYILEGEAFFKDCHTNKSRLIEYLKEYQKGA